MTGAISKLVDTFTEVSIDDEIVVMSLDSGDFFSLAGTGRAIWDLIDGARGKPAIVAQLTKDFQIDASVIEPDVDAFLAQLLDAGLITG
jgi:pyrroloquinoline quinone biosynthesis protein D